MTSQVPTSTLMGLVLLLPSPFQTSSISSTVNERSSSFFTPGSFGSLMTRPCSSSSSSLSSLSSLSFSTSHKSSQKTQTYSNGSGVSVGTAIFQERGRDT